MVASEPGGIASGEKAKARDILAAIRTLKGIENDQLYIFSHATERHILEERFTRILGDMDAAAALGPQGSVIK